MGLDEIIKTKKGEYRVTRDFSQGSGRMICIRKIEKIDEKYEEILGCAEIFQVYNHKQPLEVVAFTKEKWLISHIMRYANKSNLN